MALTAKKIARLVAKQAIGRHPDGTVKGLYLQIKTAGSASWVLRFERDGHERMFGIGPLDIVSLKQARERAKAARLQLLDGVDPINARKAAKAAKALEASRSKTFAECAEAFFKDNASGWRNAGHARDWLSGLRRYAYPAIGDLAVSAIGTGDVMRALEKPWKDVPVTARRVLQRIETVLDWAGVRGYRTGDNPARWGGCFEHLLPASNGTSIQHHAALPYTALPGFMAELQRHAGVAARALEFTILTAVRTGEALGARWREIDLGAAVWTIAGARMKGGAAHRVPLAPAAVALLESLAGDKRPDSFVFVHPDGRPLGRDALQRALARMRTDCTPHGFRSSFRDWAGERTGFPFEVLEKALAHTVGNKSSRAYARSDLLDERRKLMSMWADFACSPPAAGEVTPLRKAARP
jgi:integrase